MGIRILLADDHKIMRQGLRSLIKGEPDMEVIGEASNGQEAIKLACELSPHVIVMDVNMPDLNGIDATGRILARSPDIKILGFSMSSDKKHVLEMFQAGVSGYMLKDCAFEELVQAIRTLRAGQMYLSPKIAGTLIEDYRSRATLIRDALSSPVLTAREREVLQPIAEGKATKEIADSLNLSVKTVETHRRNIMEKLHLRGTAELTKYAIREGIISIDN
jgi:two-component system, NarL family, response regulator NreC